MQTEKTCRKCGETKPIEEFYVSDHYTGKRRGVCRRCYLISRRTPERLAYAREYQRKQYALNREQRLGMLTADIPRTGRCVVCGATDKVECHHLDYHLTGRNVEMCRGCHRRWHEVLRMLERLIFNGRGEDIALFSPPAREESNG